MLKKLIGLLLTASVICSMSLTALAEAPEDSGTPEATETTQPVAEESYEDATTEETENNVDEEEAEDETDPTPVPLPRSTTSVLEGERLNFESADEITWLPSDHLSGTMDYGMNFTAVDESDEVMAAYGECIADFIISFSEPVSIYDMNLVGYYVNWGSYQAIQLKLLEGMTAEEASENGYSEFYDADTKTIKANTPIRVMRALFNDNLRYSTIAEDIQSFDCGIYADREALSKGRLAGVTVSISLQLFPREGTVETGEAYVIGDTYSYTYPNVWSYNTDAGFYDNEGVKSGLMRYIFYSAMPTDKVEDAGIVFVGQDGEVPENYQEEEAGIVRWSVNNQGKSTTAFFADVINVPEAEDGSSLNAKGYIIVGGETIWSEVLTCRADFSRQFTE